MLGNTDLTFIKPTAMESFAETPHIKDLTDRALRYLQVGYPIHFCGSAGTGKTTLALHIANQLNRPVILIHGDEEFGTSDLIGGQFGVRTRRVVDNFIHSVLKTEEDVTRRWVDNRLTIACQYGFTLVYDEFNRSRAEANNVLLSILEEGILELPRARSGEDYMTVHPDFRAIFTSNPQEYAGVHKTQDALQDRMITMDLGYYDRETEIAITQSKARIPEEDATFIVDIVRALRENKETEWQPTIRAGIMLGKIIANYDEAETNNELLKQIFYDVLLTGKHQHSNFMNIASGKALIDKYIRQFSQPIPPNWQTTPETSQHIPEEITS